MSLRAAWLFVLVVMIAGPARAEPERFELTWVDGAVGGTAAVTFATLVFVGYGDGPTGRNEGTPPGGLDSLAPNRRNEVPASMADWVVGGALGLAVGTAAVEGLRQDQLGTRLALTAEAVAITGALTEIAKHTVKRDRPYTYDARRGREDDHYSFFSGHTSLTAAASFTTAHSLVLTRDLGPGEAASLYAGAGVLTATAGLFRIAGGMHYPTDVLTGALVGGAVGILVPELHRPSGSGLGLAAGSSQDGLRTVGLSGVF